LLAAAIASAAPAADRPVRAGGESQIDESAPDESAASARRPQGSGLLPDRLRDYVEGSLARYDALKCDAAGLRRQGWFPSFFLNDPGRDVAVESGPGGAVSATVHVCYARRDCEHRLVIAPAGQFELPGADQRFFAELLGALALFSPEIARARLVVWFGALRSDGEMTWESRGALGLTAAAARRVPAGSRTPEAVWPLLDENTIPASLWSR
jgi:hypothetical protein